LTIPNGTKIIANRDVDESAENKQGGLKQIHKKQFTYTCKQLPFDGKCTFQLIDEQQHKSDPLTIAVACAKPAAAEAARPAEIEAARPAAATTRPEAAEAGSTTAAEAGSTTAAEAGSTTAARAVAAAKPGFLQRLKSIFINREHLRSKINRRIAVLDAFFRVNSSSNIQDQRLVHRLQNQTGTDDIPTLSGINDKLKELLAKYNLPIS